MVHGYGLWTAALVVLATVGLHPTAVLHDPLLVLSPLAMVFAIASLSAAVRGASTQHRHEAVFDGLTGMFTRSALGHRTAELARLSESQEVGVGVVVLDLDHFKLVNDTHGHQRGDDVLATFAQRLGGELRSVDLAYRIGGEEFVVLVPGGVEECVAVARRLLAAVRAAPLAGVPMTASAGVAASVAGGRFDYEEVFARADAALYAAKRGGRDRVEQDPVPDPRPDQDPVPDQDPHPAAR